MIIKKRSFEGLDSIQITFEVRQDPPYFDILNIFPTYRSLLKCTKMGRNGAFSILCKIFPCVYKKAGFSVLSIYFVPGSCEYASIPVFSELYFYDVVVHMLSIIL